MPAELDHDLSVMAEARRPSIVDKDAEKAAIYGESKELSEDGSYQDDPTMEEMKTLRRVSGKIPWTSYTVTFVEFCERFSYYGTTVVFVNFIQQPRPFGSRYGNIQENELCLSQPGWDAASCGQPGGLGQGQQAATGLTVSFDPSYKRSGNRLTLSCRLSTSSGRI